MPTAAETLTLPDNRETAEAMLNDFTEVTRWARANRLGELQARFNDLDRPSLPQQVADILDAREQQQGLIEDRITSTMDNWLRTHGVVNRPTFESPGSTAASTARNKYAKRIEELGFLNLGDFAKEIWHKNPVANRMQEVNKIMNDFSSVDPQLGGALIPEVMNAEIRRLELEASIVESRSTMISMSSPTMLFPYVDWTTNVGSTFGGWTVSRVGEGADIPTSNVKFGRAKLDVTKQVAGTRIPNEMFSDVSALDGFIRSTLPQSMAFEKDYSFLTGTGAGQPLGVLNANNAALITVTKESGQLAATINVRNILKIYARMLPSSKGRAVWLVNPTTFVELQTLSIAVGTGGAPIALVNMASTPTPTMLGRPVIETEKVPALGAAGDVGLYDFTYYLTGEIPGSSLESSPHPEFMNDVTVMRMTSRNDGRPWIASPVQPRNGDTLSPFVCLGARA